MDYGMMSSVGSAVASVVTATYANKVANIQAEAANYVRGKNNEVVDKLNERNNVLTGIQRWRQSVANSRVMENAEKDREVIEVNYWRAADVRKRGSFSDQIKFAEEEGRMAAAASMAGVSGSVVDMLNNTVKLRRGMEETAKADAENKFGYDKSRLEFANYWAHLDQMDYSLIMDNPITKDYGINTPATTSLLSGLNPKDVKNVAQGAASFFQPAENSSMLTVFGDTPTDNYHEMVHGE